MSDSSHFDTDEQGPQTRFEVDLLTDNELVDFMECCTVEPADPEDCLACYAYDLYARRETAGPDACSNCGHYDPHTGAGIGVCLAADCGCAGPRMTKEEWVGRLDEMTAHITQPLAEGTTVTMRAQSGVNITVTNSDGNDGAIVVFIDTDFEPDGSDGGPGLRVVINDADAYSGVAYVARENP